MNGLFLRLTLKTPSGTVARLVVVVPSKVISRIAFTNQSKALLTLSRMGLCLMRREGL